MPKLITLLGLTMFAFSQYQPIGLLNTNSVLSLNCSIFIPIHDS